MSDFDFIQGFAEAQKKVGVLRVAAYGEDEYTWQQLYRVGIYLAKEQGKMVAAYFSDTEAAA